ncbi:MAG: FHA domain-containing protein [Pseudomonadales bacterium]|nr:FHA domain-containing protein [Pseudomonadales bacterium]
MEDATLVQNAATNLVLRSMSTNETFPLVGEMLVGREVECAITLDSGHISRYHSKISVSPNGVFIEDLKSTNGTFVNGKKISQRIRIDIGDEISFHKIAFRIVSDESGEADATLMGGSIVDTDKLQPMNNELTPGPTDTNPQLKAVHINTDNATIEAPSEAPAVQEADVAPQPIEEEPTPVREQDAGENTKLLSATDLHRRVNRSQSAQKDVQAGSGARLVITTAPLRGKVYSLENEKMGTEWKIGRDPLSDIFINDKTISGQHAKVSKVPNGYLLTAAAAKNGVIVNGHSQTRLFLSHNDKVQMGRIELVFKNDKAVFKETHDESEELSAQLKTTRRLVIGALATLTVLAMTVLIVAS